MHLAEDVPFGLVRSAPAARRAEESAQNRFEHLRNDSLEDVERALAHLPLEVVARAPAGPGRSNRWSLILRKVPS
ncbi:MAG: hypothetical protein U0271_19190 [Polyangiaceae bacterium]